MAGQESFSLPFVDSFVPSPFSNTSPLEFLSFLFKREAQPKPIRKQWEEKLYAEVPNTIERGEVEKAMQAFRAFCELSKEVKETICIPGENGRGVGTYGYVERHPTSDEVEVQLGKIPEHKRYFHYDPYLEEQKAEEIKAAGPAAEQLMEALRPMWIQIEKRAFETLQQLEKENEGNPYYKDLVKKFFPDGLTRGEAGKRHPQLMVRLMMYLQIEGKNALSANNHYDGGTSTFTIYESGPGLQVGIRAQKNIETGEVIQAEEMREVEQSEGTAFFWPGAAFTDIDPTVQPTWHGVRQHLDGDVNVGEENRSVCVAFLDAYTSSRTTPIEKTHGLV